MKNVNFLGLAKSEKPNMIATEGNGKSHRYQNFHGVRIFMEPFLSFQTPLEQGSLEKSSVAKCALEDLSFLTKHRSI